MYPAQKLEEVFGPSNRDERQEFYSSAISPIKGEGPLRGRYNLPRPGTVRHRSNGFRVDTAAIRSRSLSVRKDGEIAHHR